MHAATGLLDLIAAAKDVCPQHLHVFKALLPEAVLGWLSEAIALQFGRVLLELGLGSAEHRRPEPALGESL